MADYEVRTTDLENFVMCPYLSEHRQDIERTPEQEEKREIALQTGTRIHRSLQSYLSGPYDSITDERHRNDKALEILEPELSVEERRLSNAVVDLADKHNLPNFLVVESEYKTTFEVGEDTVTVTGHVDGIVDEGYIVDIKTAKQKWKEDVIKWKLQWKMYPVLYALSRYDVDVLDQINMKFDYWIFTKQKTVQFQGLRLDINVGQHYGDVYRIIKQYVLAKKNKAYTCNRGSSACRRCPLKKSGKCPAYSTPSSDSGTRDKIISGM